MISTSARMTSTITRTMLPIGGGKRLVTSVATPVEKARDDAEDQEVGQQTDECVHAEALCTRRSSYRSPVGNVLFAPGYANAVIVHGSTPTKNAWPPEIRWISLMAPSRSSTYSSTQLTKTTHEWSVSGI